MREIVARLRGLRRHSRHVALAACAGGLALASTPPAARLGVVALAVAALAAVRAPRLGLLVGVLVLVGSAGGSARLAAIDAPAERLDPGDRVQGLVHLTSRPRDAPFGSSVEVRVAAGPARGARLVAWLPRRTRLHPDAGPGDELLLTGLVRRPPRRSDYADHLRLRGVAAELAVTRARSTGRRRSGPAGWLDAVRRRAERGLGAGLAPAQRALGLGMVLGQDERIDPSVRDDFRAAGLAHVLAVSGQNVMLLAALALPLLAASGLGPIARLVAAIAMIALYVPLAGAGLPLQRAGVMGVASLAALIVARPASRSYALLLAATATLSLNPRACADPGWQLSFAAVAGIVALAPQLRRVLSPLPRPLAEGIAVTAAATLATAPLVAHHFGSVPLAGLPANIAALPLVAPIMWLGMVRAASGQLAAFGDSAGAVGHALGAPPGFALALLLRALGRLTAISADLPGGQLSPPLGSRTGVAVGYTALGAAALGLRYVASRVEPRTTEVAAWWRRLPRIRRVMAVGLVVVVVTLPFAGALTPPGPPAQATVSFLDVGQGDATLLQHPDGASILFDGGPPEGRVARQLRRAGIRRLSVLVMTHASRDHHGGLREVVEKVPIGLLLDGGDGTTDRDFRQIVRDAVRRGARRVPALAPMTLRAGGIAIRVLSPQPRPAGPPPEDPNPRGVTAVVAVDGFELLLSADAESPTLLGLPLLDVDAMKLPHHGSADPGLGELLARLRPEVAAITVGPNSYGHPSPDTLAALREANVRTLRTDRHGTVRLVVRGGAARVETAREP